LPLDSVRDLIDMKKRVLATGSRERREIRVSAANKTFHFEAAVEPIFDSNGAITGLRGGCIDISQRKRIEESLRDADRRKDEFLATLAHELRNPLAPIRNAVAAQKLSESFDANLNWTREIIDRQVNQMARLLDDLLDVSRIAHNKLRLGMDHAEL